MNSLWVSVEDRLPEKRGRYLVSRVLFGDKKPHIQIAIYSENLFMVNQYEFVHKMRPGWWDGDGEGDWEVKGVTHWMPLPEPPEV